MLNFEKLVTRWWEWPEYAAYTLPIAARQSIPSVYEYKPKLLALDGWCPLREIDVFGRLSIRIRSAIAQQKDPFAFRSACDALRELKYVEDWDFQTADDGSRWMEWGGIVPLRILTENGVELQEHPVRVRIGLVALNIELNAYGTKLWFDVSSDGIRVPDSSDDDSATFDAELLEKLTLAYTEQCAWYQGRRAWLEDQTGYVRYGDGGRNAH
jgi:hypothetical protein